MAYVKGVLVIAIFVVASCVIHVESRVARKGLGGLHLGPVLALVPELAHPPVQVLVHLLDQVDRMLGPAQGPELVWARNTVKGTDRAKGKGRVRVRVQGMVKAEGYGSGEGSGSGSGHGEGYGEGYGSGSGSGSGNGSGYGYAEGRGYGSGNGSGNGK
uniref:Uncharacterized protein n=1 Tax=Ananas comosus var. bracteatus TaxID=296719 RepID=A0A6V7P420_ANACO|nr:unnamed protein product [Ananas comosus var. bracteatus]